MADIDWSQFKPADQGTPAPAAAPSADTDWSQFKPAPQNRSYLGASAEMGVRSLGAAAARVVDALNPFTTSEEEAAVLYKNDPEGFQRFVEKSAGNVLDRFAREQTERGRQARAAVSPDQKGAISGKPLTQLEYATLDPEKAAYLSPTRVAGDVLGSLPSTLALMVAGYLTRGRAIQAAEQAEAAALAKGASAAAAKEAARQEAMRVGAETMAKAGAAGEGTVGYGQQYNQAYDESGQIDPAKIEQSPEYQRLIREDGYTPAMARQLLIAKTARESGTAAGVVDAATNLVGEGILGRLIGEGGKVLPRAAKGAATEAATETVQSAGEQLAQNEATQRNLDPTQSLSQGVLEQAMQGTVVGHVTGGGFAAALGRPHTEAKAPVGPAPGAPEVDALRTAVDQYLNNTGPKAEDIVAAVGAAKTVDEAISVVAQATDSLPEVAARKQGAYLAPLMDRQADLTQQAMTAPTELDRTMAADQAAAAMQQNAPRPQSDYVNLNAMDERTARGALRAEREMTANQGGNALELEVAPHPSIPGKFAIARTAQLPSLDLPAAPGAQRSAEIARGNETQNRIESAALAGAQTARVSTPEEQGRQALITRTMQAIEQRGGVASPEEARTLQEAGLGAPYDRVDPGLSTSQAALTTDQQLTQATGIALDKAPRESTTQRSGPTEQQLAQGEQNARSDSRMQGLANEREAAQNAKDAANLAAPEPKPTPNVDALTSILKKPGAQRNAQEQAILNDARQQLTPEQFDIIQRAAVNPPSLSATERLQLRRMREGDIKFSQPRAPEQQSNAAETETTQQGNTESKGEALPYRHEESKLEQGAGSMEPRQHALVTQLARIFGKKVQVFSSEREDAPDGYVRKGDDRTIYLNSKSQQSHLVVFGHELFHQLRKNNPAAYDALTKVIKLKEGADINKMSGIEGDIEEFAADLMGNRFAEPQFWLDVFNQLNDKPAAVKLGETISRVVKQFINVMKGMHGFDTDKAVANLQEVRDAARDALAQYARSQYKEAQAQNAAEQKSQQGSVQAERQEGNRGGQAAEAGRGDRVQRAAPGEEADGTRREGLTSSESNKAPVQPQSNTEPKVTVKPDLSTRRKLAAEAARRDMGLKFAEKREAYHGTPHRGIDRFSTEKIGTGEGAQAYGWGLYFAGHKSIAEFYRKQLQGGPLGVHITDAMNRALGVTYSDATSAADLIDTVQSALGEGPEAVRAAIIRAADKMSRSPYDATRARGERVRELASNDKLVEAVDREARGQLYTVHIPHDDEMLDYDARLSEQPAKVKEALASLGFPDKVYMIEGPGVEVKGPAANGFATLDEAQRRITRDNLNAKPVQRPSPLTGKDAYKELSKRLGSDKAASELLAEVGVPGLRYLDAGSRGVQAKRDTRNYVVFQDKAVEITGTLYSRKRDTPEFKKWFGNSKVVDAQGKPLVVYHGTGKDFGYVFNTQGGTGKTADTGAFFSSSTAAANSYASGEARNVMPVYIALKTPLVVDAGGANWNRIGQKARVEMPEITAAPATAQEDENLLAELEGREPETVKPIKRKAKKTNVRELFKGEWDYPDDTASTDDIARWARKQGYDGVIFRNVKDRGPSGAFDHEAAQVPADLFVAFRPEQIKSAIGNNGDFDARTPDITKSAKRGQLDNVEAYHYSQEPRKVLSSSYFGTGLKGSAREEYQNASDERRRQRISFYVDKGTGVRPESGVGGVPHRATLNNIYDSNADPLNLRKGGQAAFESAVLDQGFDGYLDRLEGSQPGQVILLGKRTVPVEALKPGPIKSGQKVEPLEQKAPEWQTQSSGPEAAMQAKAERMRGQAAWKDYDVRVTPDSAGFARIETRQKQAAPATLNVGLSTAEVEGSGQITPQRVREALEQMGVPVENLTVHESDTEPTAVVELGRALTPMEANHLSVELKQEAIAQRNADGTGELFGPKAQEWGPYNPSYFMLPDGSRAEEIAASAKRDQLNPEIVQTLGKHIRNLTPEERAKLRRDTAARLVDTIKQLPSSKEMAAVAYAGRAKRGWYYNSAKAIEHVFGADAPRFAAVLAAMSPQCSVETNLLNTLNTWKNWVKAGRPTTREEIIDVMAQSVQGGRGRASVLDAWINNTVRALSAEDPAKITLSGPKVNSFMKNLVGYADEVTNDAWMSNYALVDQTIFSGSLTKGGDPGKGVGYLAMSAQVRDAAKTLTRLTGEEWTPAEVQETIWSWAKTLYETASVNKSAEEIVLDKGITDEMLRSTPDFRTLFHDDVNEQLLRDAGLGDQVATLRERSDLGHAVGEESGTESQAAPFDPATQEGYEVRAARRLDKLRERSLKGGDIQESVKRIFDDQGRNYTDEQRAAFERVGRVVETPTLRERIAELKKDAAKKIAQGLVDQFRPLRDLSSKAYNLARLSKGSSGAVEAFLKHGQLKIVDGVYDADQSGGVVDRVFAPLQGEGTDFLWWIAANRAERLTAEERENLFSGADIEALKSLENGTTSFDYTLQDGRVTRDRTLIYRDALKVLNEFNRNAMDMAEQSGLIDGDARKIWEHEFYVPFYRQSEEGGGVAGVKSGLVRQQAFKSLKGGADALRSDLLSNALLNWSHLIDAAAKNRAAKASVEAAVALGIAEPVENGTKGAVWVMDRGEKKSYLVDDPYVMTAISSLEYAGLKGGMWDALTKFKHWLTVGVTTSPAFKIRNLVRDSVQAISVAPLGANPLSNIARGIRESNPESQTYVSALASGGLIRFGTMLEGREADRVRQLVKTGIKDSTILDNESKLRAFYDKVIEPTIGAYNELGNRSEEINRAALFAQLREQGVELDEAALAARDLMDFSMQGTWQWVRVLTQVVPFMNARLQGLYKLGRGAAEDPKRFAAVLGSVALASIALMAAYSDDDDWKKREDWDRNNFWWFKMGGVAWRIPKPFEIGAIATLAERGLELFTNKDMTSARFAKNVRDLLSDNLSMNPIPQAVKPLLDLYANKDSFTGRPIETMGMERLQPDYRFTASTSMPARAISTAGQAVASAAGGSFLSPVQIDHVLRGYFGWLGSFVVGGADMAIRPLTSEPTRPTADYWKLATQGIASETEGASSYYVSALYDQAKVLEQAYGTWTNLVKQGKVDEAREFFESNKDKIARYKVVERVKQGEAKFNELIRMIERSNMDPDQKKTRIREIRAMQDKLARVATEAR